LQIINQYQREHRLNESDAVRGIIKAYAKLHTRPQSDVPFDMPLNPEKQALLEKLRQPDKTPIPPCNYCGEGYIDTKTNVQHVYCRNPVKIKSKRMYEIIPLVVCESCFKAKQWSYKKKQREREERQAEQLLQTQVPIFTPKRGKTLTESALNGTLEYRCRLRNQIIQIDNLPCIKDNLFDCGFENCIERIQKIHIHTIEIQHKEIQKLEQEFKEQGNEITWR